MSTDPNTLLVQKIHANYGAVIRDVCKTSSVPENFLAAVIANESGGNPNAKRFESGVLIALWEVLLGRKAAYGSIGRDDLYNLFYAPDFQQAIASVVPIPSVSLQRIDSLATSWGLTQIMGYSVFDFSASPSPIIKQLADPQISLPLTLRMLTMFSHRWALDLASDFAELFACWNCGEPDAKKTTDPQYVPNGLLRMQLYGQVQAAAVNS